MHVELSIQDTWDMQNSDGDTGRGWREGHGESSRAVGTTEVIVILGGWHSHLGCNFVLGP